MKNNIHTSLRGILALLAIAFAVSTVSAQGIKQDAPVSQKVLNNKAHTGKKAHKRHGHKKGHLKASPANKATPTQ